jgi:hypothetical protein
MRVNLGRARMQEHYLKNGDSIWDHWEGIAWNCFLGVFLAVFGFEFRASPLLGRALALEPRPPGLAWNLRRVTWRKKKES